ncbi:ribonuclease III [Fontisphaera persica]|uniref:ribonuclease III n=1 Tax=Fontisphaera persica TaxID=2974023 RepID=UPI0024BFEDB4|nr:ribonuclease III [Fontisphaera persica]WCJ60831.1 ribonuclease III [Fontisphaera persica]
MSSSLTELEQRLGYHFHNPTLLQTALTHPSVAHENQRPLEHNQRLEFLGDSVLELVLTSELFTRFPNLGEGGLTKARAQLVNRRSLAECSRRLGVGEHLVLSKGEEKSGGRERGSTLADAFEALVGAIFLDGGFEAARQVILNHFAMRLAQQETAPLIENPKGELQELLQERSTEPPSYELRSVSGPDHDRVFECAVFHAGQELGRGMGKSKKAAESSAARAALERLRQDQSTCQK